ncbi:MAG TPA: acyl-CoA dehydrogenase family protein [Dehalococcoidia bacterium]|nr:acyl-CoA dehydrogenase family protein [Dehalococcoidia bacterium]
MTSSTIVQASVDSTGRRVLTHPEADTITPEELVSRARALIPRLKERAAPTEQARHLLPETVRDLTEAGFFRIVQPKRFGGFELGIDVLEDVVVEIGRGCGSTAWCMAILGGHSWFSALFNEAGQCELYGDEGHVIMSTNLSGNGRARRVEGGYELSGRFIYLSGCDIANWLCVGAMVIDTDGEPSDPESWLYAAIRPEDASIQDDWHVLGLRGTGSKTVLVDKLFVAEHMTLSQEAVQRQETPGRYIHPNPFYAAPMLAFLSIETSGAAVGLALQAVDILEDIGRNKPVRTRDAFAKPQSTYDLPAFRRRFAETRSLADAARALLRSECQRLISTMIEYVPARRKLTSEQLIEYTLNNARLADLCVQAVENAFATAGTSATFEGHPLERVFRDVHMLSTHNVFRLDQIDERWALAHFGLQG